MQDNKNERDAPMHESIVSAAVQRARSLQMGTPQRLNLGAAYARNGGNDFLGMALNSKSKDLIGRVFRGGRPSPLTTGRYAEEERAAHNAKAKRRKASKAAGKARRA